MLRIQFLNAMALVSGIVCTLDMSLSMNLEIYQIKYDLNFPHPKILLQFNDAIREARTLWKKMFTSVEVITKLYESTGNFFKYANAK